MGGAYSNRIPTRHVESKVKNVLNISVYGTDGMDREIRLLSGLRHLRAFCWDTIWRVTKVHVQYMYHTMDSKVLIV